MGGSTYKQNQAQQGGVIYCDVCKINMIGSAANPIQFQNNSAQEGGVIFIRQTTSTIIATSKFLQNYATFRGGVLAVKNSDTSITQGTILLDSIEVTNTYASSGLGSGDGGVIHMDTVQIS